MAQNMWTDPLPCDPCPLLESSKQERHPILRERQAGLGEKEVIFAATSPFGEFLFVRSMLIQVVEQITQAVRAQRNTPFLGTLAHDREDTVPAIKVAQAQ